MDKDDLIIPTFMLVALTFVWVTGTPTVETVEVEEPVSFSVTSDSAYVFSNSDHLQFREYSRQNIACTSAVAFLDSISSDKVTPVTPDGAIGTCTSIQPVEKHIVELYGFEVMLW